MPKGKNLTPEHQRAASRRPKRPFVHVGNITRNPDETVDQAVARYQKAKADVEELDALKRDIEVCRLKGDLVPVSDVRDQYEELHLEWVAELEQLPHAVAASLPNEIAASIREVVRETVTAACMAVRQRIGGAGG